MSNRKKVRTESAHNLIFSEAVEKFNDPTTSRESKRGIFSLFKEKFNEDPTLICKTLTDAAIIAGYDFDIVTPPRFNYSTSIRIAANAMASLYIVAEALNQGWIPDWNNKQEKYTIVFCIGSEDDPDWFDPYAFISSTWESQVPSRLCFKSEALAQYAATQFLDIFKIAYLYPSK